MQKFLKICGIICTAAILAGIAAIVINGKMFVMWPNIVTLVCGVLVIGTIGFIVYGYIKGFENLFPNEERGEG